MVNSFDVVLMLLTTLSNIFQLAVFGFGWYGFVRVGAYSSSFFWCLLIWLVILLPSAGSGSLLRSVVSSGCLFRSAIPSVCLFRASLSLVFWFSLPVECLFWSVVSSIYLFRLTLPLPVGRIFLLVISSGWSFLLANVLL